MKIALVIPSLRPNKDFPHLIQRFRSVGFRDIIIINDGSSKDYDSIFKEVEQVEGCIVLKHKVNLGKGRALKTAFNYFLDQFPDYKGLVTADSDGQHTPEDTLKVAQKLVEYPEKLILGARDFTGNDVPRKSKFGNNSMCLAFRLFIGLNIRDTQTGLRGIPREFLVPLMNLKGERFEYETNMLIETKKYGVAIDDVTIQTIYINNNESTHFNPFMDSLKVLSLILKFTLVSMASFLVDIVLFAILTNTIFKHARYNLLFSTVGARIVSSFFNYTCNKIIVFENSEKRNSSIVKYYALCVIQTALSWGLLQLISSNISLNITLMKAIIDTILFFISFQIQREFVFRKK